MAAYGAKTKELIASRVIHILSAERISLITAEKSYGCSWKM